MGHLNLFKLKRGHLNLFKLKGGHLNLFKVIYEIILLTKISVTQNEVALSFHRVRGLYFLVVTVEVTIILNSNVNHIIQPFMFLYYMTLYVN